MINPSVLKSINLRIELARSRAGREKDPPIEIIAVTKAFLAEAIISAYKNGIRSIGENRVQEALMKFKETPELPGLKRRLIGHLQTNKARKAFNLFDTIDSVDSMKLARKLSGAAREKEKKKTILIQVNMARDPAKFGFVPDQLDEILELTNLEGLNVEGLMTIGSQTEDEGEIRSTFQKLREMREGVNQQLSADKKMKHLSMGMSADFEIAVEEGATMLRLGTVIFGPRPG